MCSLHLMDPKSTDQPPVPTDGVKRPEWHDLRSFTSAGASGRALACCEVLPKSVMQSEVRVVVSPSHRVGMEVFVRQLCAALSLVATLLSFLRTFFVMNVVQKVCVCEIWVLVNCMRFPLFAAPLLGFLTLYTDVEACLV